MDINISISMTEEEINEVLTKHVQAKIPGVNVNGIKYTQGRGADKGLRADFDSDFGDTDVDITSVTNLVTDEETEALSEAFQEAADMPESEPEPEVEQETVPEEELEDLGIEVETATEAVEETEPEPEIEVEEPVKKKRVFGNKKD